MIQGFISPPTAFSSTKEWEDFLSRMKTHWPDAPDMILLAERELLARKLSGHPDRPLSVRDAAKYLPDVA